MSVRTFVFAAFGVIALSGAPTAIAVTRAGPLVHANANTQRAGVLRHGVLTVTLEAKESIWRPNDSNQPAMAIEAFAEPGKLPLIPGPLLRASAGTVIKLAIRNTLPRQLTFFVPARVHGAPDEAAMDSVVVDSGATEVLTIDATTPGNYVYRAALPTPTARSTQLTGLLGGALVVDTVGGARLPRDRVFVMMQTQSNVGGIGQTFYTINGRSWPNTERIHATVGDTLHWRVLNASIDVHPMHLHGFYYRVDDFDGPDASVQGRPVPGQMVVTQLLSPFAAMSLSWSPDRPGNWLFHCHFALHLQQEDNEDDPAIRDMSGLVIGTIVSGRPGVRGAGEPVAPRRIRLIAVEDSLTADERARDVVPSMRFMIEEHGRRIDDGPDFSPELDLTRGEPVAMTIVNHLREPTSVHWHGIEVEDSYVDGVPGFSGSGSHLSPAIAPGDSFVARFSPPRAGTFMYHAHFDELREQLAGLEGALIVRDPGADSSTDDRVFFLKSSRLKGAKAPVEINGRERPDTVVLHVGRRARLRLINLSTHHATAAAMFELSAMHGGSARPIDESPLRWEPVAKDGADLPETAHTPRPAHQIIAMGETYDFEYTPERSGMLRLEVLTAVLSGRGRPLLAVPIRVEDTNSRARAVQPNPNSERAGVLRDSSLTVRLDAEESRWWINGPDHPPMTIEAFAEPGKPPLMPGPLIRAPAGTSIRIEIHNSLANPLSFFAPATLRGASEGPAMDSIIVPPGGTGLFVTKAEVPGNYVYRGVFPRKALKSNVAGLLAGAIVIDTAAASGPPRDRVFVVMQRSDSVALACADTTTRALSSCEEGRISYTINGRSWPNTERIRAAVGDTLHWRVINATNDVHPMHLHGFYYRVDALTGPRVGTQNRPFPGQLVATQLLTGYAGMTMTWSPDRPGNWLFHCHFAMHLMADGVPLVGGDLHMRDMAGLVLGAIVSERPGGGVRAAGVPAPKRHLRLVAIEDSATEGDTMAVSSMRFVLEERGHRADAGPEFSPEIDLTRGEPVAITIVNHLQEPTSVHWHGVEVEDSYVDGVPGFSGSGSHLSPAIAPGDSFIARFTPPRSGTFMYHAHVDELREQMGGLEGALIVRDPGTTPAADDHVLFLKTSRFAQGEATPLEINGRVHPDTVVMHAGRTARLRLLNLSTLHPSAAPTFRLVSAADSTSRAIERWRPVAKDGADLPADARAPREAQQVVGIGEIYDFEYTPENRGTSLRLEILSTSFGPHSGGKLLLTVPIRVK